MRSLTPFADERLLVGTATGDDAAVWRLDDTRALVVTADFITPVVDDPRAWGRVAAANSVSDIYAMGGTPLLALNLVCWNEELDDELLIEVLAGADDVAREGHFVIAGGHTITDPEPKFGQAVVGDARPDRLLTNAGLRPGDQLVLTKPLGIGAITTAIKRDLASPDSTAAAIASMTRLNALAAQVALDAGATGATDVTGFGLLGHLGRMAKESGVDVRLDASRVPALPGARELIARGVTPGGTARNLTYGADVLSADGVPASTLALLADPQTSGGMLFGAADRTIGAVMTRLVDTGHDAAVIGEATTGSGRLTVTPGA